MKRIAWIILSLFVLLACNATAEGIVDYKPSVFSEHVAQPFFFSIGKKLKYGDAIREDGPTLFQAGFFEDDIREVYPSPDQNKAVLVLGDCLYLVQLGKPPAKLLQPFEHEYISVFDIQWDPQSRYIFIPRYIHNARTALLRIDTNDPITVQELIPSSQFHLSGRYFPLNDNSVCFGASTWECWISGSNHLVERLEQDQITLVDGSTIKVKPFISLPLRGGGLSLALGGYSLTLIPNSLQVEFFHQSQPSLPIFKLQGRIEPLKGHFGEGFRDGESSVLPGGRYAFLAVWNRKLVMDSETGLYKEVPKDSRVYVNFNSYGSQDFFKITNDGTGWAKNFASTKRLRTNYDP